MPVYWWGFRLSGAFLMVLSQALIFRVLTASGAYYPTWVLPPWASLQWAILIPWSGWIIWAFVRARGPQGTLPIEDAEVTTPPRYSLTSDALWSEPPTDETSAPRSPGEDDEHK